MSCIFLPCLEGSGLWLHDFTWFHMISQSVGYFLINGLKEDIAARHDLIKPNSCLSGWCIRGQDALRCGTFQGW